MSNPKGFEPVQRRRERKRDSGVFSLEGLVLPAGLLLFWFLSTRSGAATVLPPPEKVFSVLLAPGADIASSGSLLWNIYVSLVRVLLGLLAGIAIGTPIGFLMGSSVFSRRALYLVTELARPLSPLALLPLSIIIFRDTTLTKVLGLTYLRYSRHIFNEVQLGMIFVLFWGAVFPVILDTMHGVRGIRNTHYEVARVSGAGKWFTFTHLMIPASLPDILAGYRMAMGRTWMVIIAAEMLPGTNSGIGYLLRYSYTITRYDVMLACILIIAMVGAVFSKGLADMGEARLTLRARER